MALCVIAFLVNNITAKQLQHTMSVIFLHFDTIALKLRRIQAKLTVRSVYYTTIIRAVCFMDKTKTLF